MADDVFKDTKSNVDGLTKSIDANTDSLKDWKKSMDNLSDVEGPDVQNLQNFEQYVNKATEAQKKWTDEIKESVKYLTDQARAIGSRMI